jgi:hypothetical protein
VSEGGSREGEILGILVLFGGRDERNERPKSQKGDAVSPTKKKKKTKGCGNDGEEGKKSDLFFFFRPGYGLLIFRGSGL